MKKKIIVLLLMMCTLAINPAQAEDNSGPDKPLVSVSPYLGWGLWSQDLGVENSFVYGGRAALHPLHWLSLEGTYGRSDTELDGNGPNTDLEHYGVDLVAHLRSHSRVTPYVSVGWAQMDMKVAGGQKVPLNGGEAAIGLKALLAGDHATHTALRLELRDVMTDLNEDFGNDGDFTHNLIMTAGLEMGFGKSNKDTDGDGVRDKEDACPDTPAGAVIDEHGCPVDSDGDGVYDGLDQCEGTPAGATVDQYGCPSDSDRDGVLDGLDKCVDTPAGAKVDAHGCPLDSDGDGVYDGLDKCPDTDSKLQVDVEGCPIAVTEMEVQLLDTGSITTSSIVFETSSSEIAAASKDVLAEIGETLSRWPELRVEIGGYTDSSGSATYNQRLSEQRAQSVLEYLLANYPGITSTQYTVKGYGEENPLADNETAEGRAANRRVEFKVLNTEELKIQIEKRRLLER
jgi:OOP family OmpA-OmpF porin